MLQSAKRSRILALFKENLPPRTIIEQATTGPADRDYERRLRLWAADCAARASHLIVTANFPQAERAVKVARSYVRGLLTADNLKARFSTHLAAIATRFADHTG